MNNLISAMEIGQIHPFSIAATPQQPIPNVSAMADTKCIGYSMNQLISEMEIGSIHPFSIAATKSISNFMNNFISAMEIGQIHPFSNAANKCIGFFDEQVYLVHGNRFDSSYFHCRNQMYLLFDELAYRKISNQRRGAY